MFSTLKALHENYVKVGASSVCGKILFGLWAVCGQSVVSARATVNVALPAATGVTVTVSSSKIAQSTVLLYKNAKKRKRIEMLNYSDTDIFTLIMLFS